MGKVVGIDLGTTNSVVSVIEGGKPVVIANSEGMRTTPSVVAFSKEGELLVGQMARRQSVLNPQNTFYGVKRYIGRKYSELSPESKRVPYTVRRDDLGNVKIKCPRLEKDFAPEEVSAMVLRKLADEASRYLGEPVTGAVITVPAYFNDSQRQATRDAGRIAGLDVLRIINEPTAASLAYGLDRVDSQVILVFDLGGGTFDVSVLEVGDGVFEVRSTAGDTQLGGADFDKKIVDWLADQFLEKENIDLRRDRQSLQRLMEAAEKAKIELSGVSVSEINLPFITATEDGPKHLETRLTRSQFESLCPDLISRLRGPVKQAVRDANLGPDDIDEIVLVGGSTRMPMVKDLVRSLINREPNENVNPDEVVAVGAAIQAGILTQEVRDILLLDVTPLSLGLETIGGVTKKLIPRNTTIPVRRSDIFSTSENNQTMVEVHVLQGEREMAADNKSLGRFKLMGIPPAPRGVPQVQVSLDIDANGILQVTAVDKTTGREQGITIQGASTLSEAEVQRMIQDAETFAQKDRQRREQVEKRTRAEALTYQAERQLREVALDFGIQFASEYRRRIENLVQELRDALKQDDDRRIDVAEADLRDSLYDLQHWIYDINQEEEGEGILGSIKRTLFGDEDDDFFYGDRDYAANGRYADSAYGNRWDDRNGWGSRQERWDARRDVWDDQRDGWDVGPRRRPAERDGWDRRPAARQDDWDRPVRREPPRRDPDRWDDDRWGDRRPANNPPPARRDRSDWDAPPPRRSNRWDEADDGWESRRPSPPARDPEDAWEDRRPSSSRRKPEDAWDRPRSSSSTPRDLDDAWDRPRSPAPPPRDTEDMWDRPRSSTPAPRDPDEMWDRPRSPSPPPRDVEEAWDRPQTPAPDPRDSDDMWDRSRSPSLPPRDVDDFWEERPARDPLDNQRDTPPSSPSSRSSRDSGRRRPANSEPSRYGQRSWGEWDDDEDDWL